MKAVLCTDFIGTEGLEIAEIDAPVPEPEEILVDVHAASVSFMDYLMVSGGYQMRPELPYVPGTESAGVVVAVGDKVTQFKPGDRVACCDWIGGFAERMTSKEWKAVKLPDGVEFAAASTILHNYTTAYYALIERARLKAGETLLVTGASGGVGLAVVDVGRKLGARVIAAVGGADKAAFVRDYGAAETIDYAAEDLRDRVKELTDGAGVDVCFENLGGATFQTMARLMNWGGRLMPIGFASGAIPDVPMNLPLLKNYSIVGVFTGAWTERFREESRRANETIMEWLRAGEIRPHIDRELPLERVAEAMQAIADRTVRGRIVLKVR
ncbi:MAG TPA: NADPH:quinone oxidoreductase family protein [Alphaproteobacteria bacterium]|nr:NADPH:quinone oxidoreductase family protein [Alphaproteobacteria bacterium]